MLSTVVTGNALLAADMPGWLFNTLMFLKVLIGFSVIIFVHELGHFLAAKWAGVRVDRFAIGFGTRLFGWRGGEGFTLGNRPDYSADELKEKNYAETDYCFKVLPVGGYVKMLGQDDVIVNEETGEMSLSDDPRAFTNRPVGQRMVVVSAGVIFNILFAALLLMCVFLIGKEANAPVVGIVDADSPAQGVLFPGDRILEIDGSKVRSFDEIISRVALSGADVRLKIERGGRVLGEPLDINTTIRPDVNIPMLGIAPLTTLELVTDIASGSGQPELRAGDVVVAIDGNSMGNALDVRSAFQQSHGRALEVTVKRPKPGKPAEFDIVTCLHRASLVLDIADLSTEGEGTARDNAYLLGLRPRHTVNEVFAGRPADKAGFKKGDIIVSWGTVLNPTLSEIRESTRASVDQTMRAAVLRDGKEVELTVTPKRPFKLFGEQPAEVGIDFGGTGDIVHPVIADVAPNTPFSELNMPRGAEIVALDGQPVRDWYDLAEILMSAPGRAVQVRYRAGSEETVGQVKIPSSIVDQLTLPPGAIIRSVDGEKSFAIASPKGRKVIRQLSAGSSLGLRTILKEKIGKDVVVRYSDRIDSETREATFHVTEANYDPWQLRVIYDFDITAFKPMKDMITANGNPLVAMGMGVDYVCDFVRQMYLFMTRLADRSIGTENVAGPVGIISIAVQRAKAGTAELLLFLAFLSVNLAVINFLPMPVMDGGLMVFLLIEKIKGKPLGLKAQMISTMVGLGAIIIIGLYVTIQDIGRFF